MGRIRLFLDENNGKELTINQLNALGIWDHDINKLKKTCCLSENSYTSRNTGKTTITYTVSNKCKCNMTAAEIAADAKEQSDWNNM